MQFTLTCARGTEALLRDELEELGLQTSNDEDAPRVGAIRVHGGLEQAYRAMTWSRLAARVLLPIASFEASDPDALYEAAQLIPWWDHLSESGTFIVDVAAARDRDDHTRFLAQRTKDAIVDCLRERTGTRPSVDAKNPGVRIHLHWASPCTLSIDLAGPLHRRGYRPRHAPAPLRETLAAALVRASGWTAEEALFDPMCGSGTLLVEAAWVAMNRAPGLDRPLGAWLGHDSAAYRRIMDEAHASLRSVPLQLFGSDRDPEALELAKASLLAAGVKGVVLSQGDASEMSPPAESGHVLTNPPYGERLGDRGELLRLYPRLGDLLKQRFAGWRAHILTSDRGMLGRVGLKPERKLPLSNGPLECTLASYTLWAAKTTDASTSKANEAGQTAPSGPKWRTARPEAAMFRNRLKKNLRRLKGWAKGAQLEAWRVYDAEIPEYNVSVDRYGEHVVLQEHRRPLKVDERLADARLDDAMKVVREMFGLSEEQLHVRVRKRHTEGGSQYEKRGEDGTRMAVREGPHSFEVNLTDYLDTGLFLDHRRLRKMVADEVKRRTNASVLNLFAYTCSASVYAASKGADVTSVDLSSRYLEWGRDNFRRNEMSPASHRFIRTDVVEWLGQARDAYDVILLAPPSYSRSKGMRAELDLVRDHASLIRDSFERVAPGGVLFFSTHARAFRLDETLAKELGAVDITGKTVPRDFREPHRSWRFDRG